MKTFNPTKQLIFIVLPLFSGVFNQSCQKDDDSLVYPKSSIASQQSEIGKETTSRSTASASNSERIYIDLFKDPMIPGGISESMLQDYRDRGYILRYLKEDLYSKGVSFKRPDGKVYYRMGWLKQGIPFLEKEGERSVITIGGNLIMKESDIFAVV